MLNVRNLFAVVVALFVLSITPAAEAGCLGVFGRGLSRVVGRERRQARQSARSGTSYQSYRRGGACANGACATPQAIVHPQAATLLQ